MTMNLTWTAYHLATGAHRQALRAYTDAQARCDAACETASPSMYEVLEGAAQNAFTRCLVLGRLRARIASRAARLGVSL
jgi:hypothetical protein